MTHDTPYETLRAIIAKAVPESLNQDIELSDVLRTIEMFSNKAIIMSTDGRIGEVKEISHNGFHGKVRWNMGELLDSQSPETIAFLLSVLSETK